MAARAVTSVIGIDVGGSRKGFHAVALSAGAYAGQLATTEVQELAHWCRALIGAQLIVTDAPLPLERRWPVQSLPAQAHRRRYPLLAALPPSASACFETFPHAITPAPLTSIDLIAAAICALAAHHLASGSY